MVIGTGDEKDDVRKAGALHTHAARGFSAAFRAPMTGNRRSGER